MKFFKKHKIFKKEIYMKTEKMSSKNTMPFNRNPRVVVCVLAWVLFFGMSFFTSSYLPFQLHPD